LKKKSEKIDQISEANRIFDDIVKIINVEEDFVIMQDSDNEDFSSVPASSDELIEFNKPNFEFISERDFSLESSFKDLKLNNEIQVLEFNLELKTSLNISEQLIFVDDLVIIG
jgi:hypothetical protein